MKQRDAIFLIGFSGSGKSTIGSRLAQSLKFRFFDTDEIVTKQAKMSIPDIFRTRGEKYFRSLEQKAIAGVVRKYRRNVIVALGGGAFQSRVNRDAISEAGTVVYLSCSQVELYRRMRKTSDRPLLMSELKGEAAGGEALRMKIRSLLKLRIRYYRQADITVSTTGKTVAEAARELKSKLVRYYAGN